MVASAFTAPHVTEFLTVDVTPTMELLARLKDKPGVCRLQAHAADPRGQGCADRPAAAIPTLNARWDEANQEIVQFNYVNLGIAAATPRGPDGSEHQGRGPAVARRSSPRRSPS